MRINIRNMVCRNCVRSLRHLLESEGYRVLSVGLGYADIDAAALDDAQLQRLDDGLRELGFERIVDKAAHIVEEVKRVILEHISTDEPCPLTLSHCIAEAVPYDYKSVSRLFSATEGRTIEKYYVAAKIEKTKELLSYGDITLSEIAFRLGYSSTAFLSRQFKQETGMTPTEYQRTPRTQSPERNLKGLPRHENPNSQLSTLNCQLSTIFRIFAARKNIQNMKKIALVTGGNSGEYEVSLRTAENIMEKLDKSKFEPYLIHLKDNKWTYTHTDGQVIAVNRDDFSLTIGEERVAFDAVFIAIHGNPGENGRLQGYFDMIGMRYTGCDMLSSALTFNKFYCNIVVRALGLPVSPSLHYFKGDLIDYEYVGDYCQYPCFVKPCNSGSSVGVTKVHDETELASAIEEAFKYDSQLMIEKFLPGREVTCGVGCFGGKVRPLAVTEIVCKDEFYDYETKYTDGTHELITPADIPAQTRDLIFAYSEKLYKEMGCGGIVRVDFIISPDGIPYFLEVNTIPGQTALSIIPSQISALGLNITDVYSELIEQALLPE